MGILDFNGEDVSQVFANTQPLNDNVPQDRYTNNLLQAIVKERPITDALFINLLTGNRSTLVNGFYNYGKNDFIYGLPFTDISNDFFNEAAVKTVIDSIVGSPVTLTASYLYIPTLYSWSKWWLQENEPSYDYTTNTLTIGPTTWDVAGFLDETDEFTGVREITVQLENGLSTDTYGPITEFWDEEGYYIVEYYITTDPIIRFIWLYKPSLETYPTLNITPLAALNNTISDDFFPIIPIRMAEKNINKYEDQNLIDSVDGILSKLFIDLDEFTDGVTKEPNEDGDLVDIIDLPKISDMFILYGINIYNNTHAGKKYLYTFFDQLALISRIDKATYEASTSDLSNVFFIRQATFFYWLKYNYIEISTTDQIIGEVGDYSTEYIIEPTMFVNPGSPTPSFFKYNSYFIIHYQIEKGVCRCIKVHGLRMEHTINERGLRNTIVELEAFNPTKDLTDNQRNFIIPLSKSSIDALTNREADNLIPISLHLVVYAGDTIHLDWGEANASFLKIVLRIIGLVLFISGAGPEALTLEQLVTQTLVYLVSVAAIEYTLKKVFLKTDNDVIRAIAVVVAIVAIQYIGPDFSSMGFADQLISTVNAVSIVTNTYTAAEFELLGKEILTLQGIVEEKEKELQDAYKFLEVSSLINLDTLIDTKEYKYEEPDDFFARTLNTAPGQMTFDQLHNYVDNALNLEYI